MSSAEGHARKQRVSRAKKENPKLVLQLKKDLKYEMENASLSMMVKLRNAETASRCLGAMVLRNFIVRALFRQMARAFYTLLTSGVDHQHVAQLKAQVNHHQTQLTNNQNNQSDVLEELRELRLQVQDYKHAALSQKVKILKPILRRYSKQLRTFGLRAWTSYVEADRKRMALQSRAVSFFSNRHLRMAFDRIKRNVTQRNNARAKLYMLGAVVIKIKKRNYLRLFKRRALGELDAREERAKCRELQHQLQQLRVGFMVGVLRRNHKTALLKAFCCLRDAAARERQYEIILSRAMKKLRHKIIRRWFHCIQDHATHNKQQKTAIHRLLAKTRVRLLKKGVKQWLAWYKDVLEDELEAEEMRKQLLRIVGRLANRYIAAGFESWYRQCQTSKRQAIIMKRAGARIRNKTLNSALGTWCEYVRDRKHARGLAGRVFGRMLKGKLMMGWYTWHRYIINSDKAQEELNSQRKRMLRILSRLTQKKLSDGFLCWVAHRNECLRREQIFRRAGARMRNKSMHAALRTWCNLVRSRKHSRALAGRVFGRMLKGKLMMGWYTWHRYIINSDKAQEELNSQRKRMLRILSRLTQKKLSDGFLCWVAHRNECLRREQILRRAGARIRNRKIAATFATWHFFWTTRKHDRRIGRKVLSRMAQAKISSAFNSWLSDVKEQKRHEVIMFKIAARLKYKTVAAALNTWQAMVVEAKEMRVLLRRAALRMMRRALVQTFERWADNVDDIVRSRGQLQRAVAKFQNRMASAAFDRWTEVASDTKRMRVICTRIALKMKNRVVSSVWNRWLEYVLERVHARKLCQRVMGRMINVKVFGAVQTWVAAVANYKRYLQLLHRTRSRMVNRLVSSAWATWYGMLVENKRNRFLLQRAAQKMRNRVVSACFDTWIDSIQEAKSNRYAVTRAVKMWSNRTYSAVFNTWLDAILTQIRNRNIVQRTLKRMTMRKVATALTSWVDFTNERQHMRRLVRKVLGRLHNLKMHAAWRSWLQRLEALRWAQQLASLGEDEQQALRDRKLWEEQRAQAAALAQQRRDRAILRVLTRIKNRGLVITFDAWLAYTIEVLRVRMLLKRAATKMAKRGLCIGFEGWYDSVQEIKTNRLRVQRCLIRMQQRALVIALNTWVDAVDTKKQNQLTVKRCLKKLANRVLNASYTAWLDYTDSRIHHRWLVGRVLGRLLNSKLVSAWQKWHGVVKRLRAIELGDENALTPAERQCKRVVTRMLNNLTNSAWDTWRSHTNEHRRLEHLLQRVMRKWTNQLLGRCFDGWADAVATQLQHKRILRRVAAKWKLKVAAACFRTWSEETNTKIMNRVRVARCLRKIKNRALDSAFQGWSNGVYEIKRRRTALKQAALKMKFRKASMAFEKWYDCVAETKRLRHLLKKAGQKIKNRTIAMAFGKWQAIWHKKQRVKHLLGAILGRQRKHQQNQVVQRWKTKVSNYNAKSDTSICGKCRRKIAKEKALEAREKNWSKEQSNGIPLLPSEDNQRVGGHELLDGGGSALSLASPSGSGLRGARALSTRTKLLQFGHSIQLGLGASLVSTTGLLDASVDFSMDPNNMDPNILDPNGQQQQTEKSNKEIKDLLAKTKRASKQVHTLRERLTRVKAQYELRLQITMTRSEEQQHQLKTVMKQQQRELHVLQETWDGQSKLNRMKQESLNHENNQLRDEILNKQKLLERSITQRQAIETSLIEMNRKWRNKGRSEDQMTVVLNRVSSALSSSGSRAGALHSSSRVSASLSTNFEPDEWSMPSIMETAETLVPMALDTATAVTGMQNEQQAEEEQEMKIFIAQLSAEKNNVVRMNANLETRLYESQRTVADCTKEMERAKAANAKQIADMSTLAIEHNIGQHQKMHALSANIAELQATLKDTQQSNLLAMQAKELELSHCENVLRAKELELTQLERAYNVAKLEATSSLATVTSEMSRVFGEGGREGSGVRGERGVRGGSAIMTDERNFVYENVVVGVEEKKTDGWFLSKNAYMAMKPAT